MKTKTVAILMATYNGEKYIAEQIESILNQTYQDFVLFIRDDNSTDSTNEIVSSYVQKYPDKLVKVKDNKVAKGACNNFMFLLEYVYNLNKYEMFMFSDQDDVWFENKVYDTLEEYFKIQDKDAPILIHTDLSVVDEQLNIVSESFLKYSNLERKDNGFNRYLIQNNVTGCTTFINKSLVNLINFEIKNMIMHDWYLALIASSFGKIIFVNKSTIKYRQHNNNTLGAVEYKGTKDILKKIKNNLKNQTIRKDLDKVYKQAESFKNNYYKLFNENNKKTIDDFCKIKDVNKINRILLVIKNKFYKTSLIRIIAELIFI